MRTIKVLTVAALLAGASWVGLRVHIEGRTPYNHFKAAGGEAAVLGAVGSARDTVMDGAHHAWGWVLNTGSWAADGAAQQLDDASRAASAGWEAWREPVKPAASPRPRRSGRAALEALPTPARVQALTAAAPHGNRPAEKSRTQVDRRVGTDERAALDARLAQRRH